MTIDACWSATSEVLSGPASCRGQVLLYVIFVLRGAHPLTIGSGYAARRQSEYVTLSFIVGMPCHISHIMMQVNLLSRRPR
jgi:hypothetical protein